MVVIDDDPAGLPHSSGGASVDQLRAALHHSSVGILAVGADGELHLLNPAAARILGMETGGPAGQVATHFHQGLDWLADKGPAQLVAHRQDGTESCVEVTVVANRVAGSALLVATLRELSGDGAMGVRLGLADRMASLGRLAAGMAHQINDPLAYIAANVAFCQQELADLGVALETGPGVPGWRARVTELQTALSETLEGARRAQATVKDLKTFANAHTVLRGPVDLHAVLDASVSLARHEIRHRARLVKDYGTPMKVDAAEAHLAQVFLNLLLNATQALPEGQADQHEIRILTRLTSSGVVEVEVSDSGEGVPPEVISRIFEPFFSTRATGAGLGLWVCRSLVKSWGGSISARAHPAGGSTFTVCLRPAPTLSQAPRAAAPQPPRRGRVLVVDDEPLIVTVLQKCLSAENDVMTESSAVDALKRLTEGAVYDVILCDMMMPDMTGMDLHQALLRTSPGQAERMVFLTGGAFTTRTRQFLQAVPNTQIEKPFDPGHVRQLVRDMVSSAKTDVVT